MSFSLRFSPCSGAGALPLAFFAMLACDSSASLEGFVEEGVSWELAQLRESTLEDVEYQYALQVPEERDAPIRGSVRVTFIRNDPDDLPVIFDFLHPRERVTEVRVGDSVVASQFRNDHVLVPIPREEGQGPVEVTIDFIAGDESLNRNQDFLYALFVPERARYSLPLFDQPNLKARFAVFLDLPISWTAMANGRQVREQVEGDRRRFQFASSEPLPTYLFTFVAGEFEKVVRNRGGRVMEFMHRETDTAKVQRNLDDIFQLHETALDWLEAYTGIPYPFQKMGFVAIPAFQYGGMEHPGAIFYRDRSLFLDESATQSQRLGRASLIAHETAHMWFGDLVTMNWFDDVWTKEVFANFMAARIVHPSFPDLNHQLRFLLTHHPSAYGVDRTEGANPIRQPLENLKDAGTLYGAIIYQKAPVVMRQLETLVGEEVFREGVREYLNRFAFDNATWPDLIRILDDRSPEDLAGWSRVWVEEPGRPTIWVDMEEGVGEGEKMGSVVLRQADPLDQGRIWPQPLEVALGYGTGAESIPVRLLDASLELEDAAGRPRPDFILPDGWGLGYGLFSLDQESRRYLLEQLPSLEDPVVRGAGWLALWDGVLEGDISPREFLSLAMDALPRETEEQILQRILGSLDHLYWNLISPEDRLEAAPALEALLWEESTRGGDTSRQSTFFRAFRNLALTPESLGRLEGVWQGEVEIPDLPFSEEDRTSMAMVLALHQVPGWEGILQAQTENIQNPDRKDRFIFLRPSLDPDPGIREAFFQELLDPENREKEPWVLSALSNLHHPLRRHHARSFIRPSLEILEEIQRTGDIFFPGRWVGATLGSHNTPEAAEVVRGFLEDRPDFPFRLRLKVLQGADPLFRAVEILHGPWT